QIALSGPLLLHAERNSDGIRKIDRMVLFFIGFNQSRQHIEGICLRRTRWVPTQRIWRTPTAQSIRATRRNLPAYVEDHAALLQDAGIALLLCQLRRRLPFRR